MKKLMTAGIACLVLTGIVSLAIASDSPSSGPMTGVWECVSHDAQRADLEFTLSLKQNGGHVTGDLSSSAGNLVVSSGTFKNGKLQMLIQGDSGSYKAEATYEDGKLSGTWTSNDSSRKGTWEGKKAPKSAQ